MLNTTYYLAGPMSGIEEYNYPAFKAASEELRSFGMTIEPPHENEWPEGSLSEEELWEHMMQLGKNQMERCQAIILLKGWPQSRGARRELKYAMDNDWPVYYYENWVLTDMNGNIYEQ